MMEVTHIAFVTYIIALVSIAVLTVLASVNLSSTRLTWTRRSRPLFYEDEDGEATVSSLACHSDKAQLIGYATTTFLGCSISAVHLLIASSRSEEAISLLNVWLQLALWVVLCPQVVALWMEPVCTKRFQLGVQSGLSCLIIATATAIDGYSVRRSTSCGRLHAPLSCAQMLVGIMAACCSLLIPRRPDVFRDGMVVDREATTNFLSRVTFKWAGPLLRTATRMGPLDVEKLPTVRARYSAREMIDPFTEARTRHAAMPWQSYKSTLWRSIRGPLLCQTLVMVSASILSFAPQGALYALLRGLEIGRGHDNRNTDAWVSVILLGLPLILVATLHALGFWLGYRDLYIRAQQQFMIALFEKTLDSGMLVQTPSRDDEAHDCKSIINLMAADVRLVASFLLRSFELCDTPLRIVISWAFLVRLVGWQMLVVSVGVILLLYPVNTYSMRRYSTSQTNLMGLKDRKLSALGEVLSGLRHIKCSASEAQWESRVNSLRDQELKAQWAVFVWDLVMEALYLLTPTMVSTLVLTLYVLMNGPQALTPAIAFTTISVLDTMQSSLVAIPGLISGAITATVSARRLQKYLDCPDKRRGIIPSDTIEFDDATISWPGAPPNQGLLREVNVSFPPKALSLVTGQTGAGKSLLLAAIVNQSDIIRGTVKAPAGARQGNRSPDDHWLLGSAVAYVPQVPWVEATSIRDNITFGLPFDTGRYREVVAACALESDLCTLPDGDKTALGPNGVNLSGGQKARISLARALYSRAMTLVLDDIFSAVDVHTAAHLYTHALTGPLGEGRTRVLVTHHPRVCLQSAQYLVCLDRGTVGYSGPAHTWGLARGVSADALSDHHRDAADPQPQHQAHTGDDLDGASAEPREYVGLEQYEQGAIRWDVIVRYMRQSGTWIYWAVLILSFVAYSTATLVRVWWLGVWSGSQDIASPKDDLSPEQMPGAYYYVAVYVGLSAFAILVSCFRGFYALSESIRASQGLFRQLLTSVLRVRLRWIDTVPVGRVLNRFSSDFNIVDSRLARDIRGTLSSVTDILLGICPTLIVNPALWITTAALGLLTMRYATSYLAAARNLKRLESVATSLIYEHVGSCITGLATIAAYGRMPAYQQQFRGLLDRRVRIEWHVNLFNSWLELRVGLMAAIFTLVSAACLVYLQVDGAYAGFVLGFTMKLSYAISMTVHQYTSLELGLNSVERVLEYCDLEREQENPPGAGPAPEGWPSNGVLEVKDLVTRYSMHSPDVLSGVSFTANANERVGVVGRTGAGKSTLSLALFRFLEASCGAILIDGIDVSTIRLQDLRSHLAIIPQTPFLFKGTVRSNLDPFGEFGDERLLSALAQVRWDFTGFEDGSRDSVGDVCSSHRPCQDRLEEEGDEVFSMMPSQCDAIPLLDQATHTPTLDVPISDGGSNLSHGEQQLLCLARVVVRKPKLLVMDEATSAMDAETDKLVQRSVRSAFDSATLIVITHRLRTVADFDKILVLSDGRVLEYGSPTELMREENGHFRQMVEEDAERAVIMDMIAKD